MVVGKNLLDCCCCCRYHLKELAYSGTTASFVNSRFWLRMPRSHLMRVGMSSAKGYICCPCNRKTYTHLFGFPNYFPPNLHLHFLSLSGLILLWCKLSCHTKLAAPKLTLTLPNLFRINSVQTYTYTFILYEFKIQVFPL